MKSSDSRAFSNSACLQGPSWRRVSPSLPPDRRTDRQKHGHKHRVGGHHRRKSWETGRGAWQGAPGPQLRAGVPHLGAALLLLPPAQSFYFRKRVVGPEIRSARPCLASLACSETTALSRGVGNAPGSPEGGGPSGPTPEQAGEWVLALPGPEPRR